MFLQTEKSSNRTSQNNVFFMLHTKNNFSCTNKDNPAFWLMMSECSFNCITSLISQSMHLTFLASTMLVVLLTMRKPFTIPVFSTLLPEASGQSAPSPIPSPLPQRWPVTFFVIYLHNQNYFLFHSTSASTWTQFSHLKIGGNTILQNANVNQRSYTVSKPSRLQL